MSSVTHSSFASDNLKIAHSCNNGRDSKEKDQVTCIIGSISGYDPSCISSLCWVADIQLSSNFTKESMHEVKRTVGENYAAKLSQSQFFTPKRLCGGKSGPVKNPDGDLFVSILSIKFLLSTYYMSHTFLGVGNSCK